MNPHQNFRYLVMITLFNAKFDVEELIEKTPQHVIMRCYRYHDPTSVYCFGKQQT